MISIQVNDMSCGHCVSSITRALKAIAANATVQIDLAAHRVDIEAKGADAGELARAIQEAGYTPVVLTRDSSGAAPAATVTRGGCCSSRERISQT